MGRWADRIPNRIRMAGARECPTAAPCDRPPDIAGQEKCRRCSDDGHCGLSETRKVALRAAIPIAGEDRNRQLIRLGIPRNTHCPPQDRQPYPRSPPQTQSAGWLHLPGHRRRHRPKAPDRNRLRNLRYNPEDMADDHRPAPPAASRNSGSQKAHTRPRIGTDRDEHPAGDRHRCSERRTRRHCLRRHCRQ